MKKIILLIISILFLIEIISAAEIPLESILTSEDLQRINDNIKDIKEDYDIKIIFEIVDSTDSVIRESIETFDLKKLNQGNMVNYNLLVFYNIKKNQLRMVTYKDCSLGYEDLKNIKDHIKVLSVIEENNPTNLEISKMFLFISDETTKLIHSLNPTPQICSLQKSENKINLRNNEYIIPEEVLKAMYVITMEKSWEESYPGGIYISENFIESKTIDFLPFVTSKKEKFFNILKKKTTLSKDAQKYYYDLLTTKGNIILSEDYTDSILFHERIHKIISEDLNEEEQTKLAKDQKEIISEPEFSFPFVPSLLKISIVFGNWQEIYAYMAQYEEYPETQKENSYIDPDIYNMFYSEYPESYLIYEKVLNLAR